MQSNLNTSTIRIRPPYKSDYAEIATLHSKMIPKGFLSEIGEVFLSMLYESIQKEKKSTVYVAETNDSVVGFIAGTLDIRKLYHNVLLRNWHRFCFPIMRFIFSTGAVRRVIETIMYGLKKEKNDNVAVIGPELLAIAVDASVQKKGLGRLLMNELEEYFKAERIVSYKVVTFSMDEKANMFYRSCGFTLNRTFKHHANIMNEYIKVL